MFEDGIAGPRAAAWRAMKAVQTPLTQASVYQARIDDHFNKTTLSAIQTTIKQSA